MKNFIASLADANLPEEQQSYLLNTSEKNIQGGDNVQGSCSNARSQSCAGINDKCTNYGKSCDTSTNRKTCVNRDEYEIVPDN